MSLYSQAELHSWPSTICTEKMRDRGPWSIQSSISLVLHPPHNLLLLQHRSSPWAAIPWANTHLLQHGVFHWLHWKYLPHQGLQGNTSSSRCVLVSSGTVTFLPSSGYSVLVWIKHEKNVGNTLMFLLLLSSAYPKSKIFPFPLLCKRGGAQEGGREHGQDSWPEVAKRTFPTIGCHAQNTNWEQLAWRYWPRLRDFAGQQAVSDCIVHHSFCVLLLLLLLLFSFSVPLNSPHLNSWVVLFFRFSPPSR